MKNIKNRLMAMVLVLLLTGAAVPAMAVERMTDAAAVERRSALMVDENGDFTEGVHDALFRLGGTKLRFVVESTVNSDEVIYTDKRGTIAYALRNGEWLEVHTLGKEFMLPKDASDLFDGIDYPKFAKLTAMDLNGFNTSKVRDMSYMFSGCSALESLDLSSFKTSKVEDMKSMFIYCASLVSLDLSHFNTSSVTCMESMFNGYRSLISLNLSNFDTSKVKGMSEMFKDCHSLTSLDLGSFLPSPRLYCPAMFLHTPKRLKLKLSDAFRVYLEELRKGGGFFMPGETEED